MGTQEHDKKFLALVSWFLTLIFKHMKLNHFGLGFGAGIIAPVLALFVFYAYQFDSLTLKEFFSLLNSMGITMQVLSFCSMPSFLLFFLFYYFNYNRTAQGLVGATLVITLALVIFNSIN